MISVKQGSKTNRIFDDNVNNVNYNNYGEQNKKESKLKKNSKENIIGSDNKASEGYVSNNDVNSCNRK